MRFRLYKAQAASGSTQGVVEEVRQLVRHSDADANYAGLDFYEALKRMAHQRLLLASPVSRQALGSLFGATESLWAREVRHHSLYLSRIAFPPGQGTVEVRALLACNGSNPESIRVQTAARRHKLM